MPQKISSVLELARYQVGDSAWWVTLRYQHPLPDLLEDNKWMESCHPKVLYEHGPYKSHWMFRSKLPKLHHTDFEGMVALLTSEFVVEKFNIHEIIRSNDTGEFFYSNHNDEWMPESFLFDTAVAARRECARIIKMIRKWINIHS